MVYYIFVHQARYFLVLEEVNFDGVRSNCTAGDPKLHCPKDFILMFKRL